MEDRRLVAQTRSLGLDRISAPFLPHFCLTRRFFAVSSGKSVRESSVRSGMGLVQAVAITVFTEVNARPVIFRHLW